MSKKENLNNDVENSELAEGLDNNAAENAAEEMEETLSIEAIKSASISQSNNEDFDWDGNKKNTGGYSDAERAKLEALYSGSFNSIEKDQIVSGTVMMINEKDVVLNIGFKSDGMVALSEFRDMPELKINDTVEVYVEEREDKNGQLILSRKRAKTQRSWDLINQALIDDAIMEGLVKSRTKGGLIVDIMGVEAFLPGSQIDIKPIRDYDIYVGKTMEFKIVKINNEFKNVVVSHKVLIEEDIESQKVEIVSKLEKGQVLEGTVKNITDFGVFIDLGGVDGLLHITDISWGRIEHPKEVLALDQKINVVVLDFDDEKKRIALGLKQLTAHPWDALDASIDVGTKIKGKVVTVAEYGAFVEVIPGVEGLIHISEMSWSQNPRNPQDFMKAGDEIEAVVISIDREDHKMSLGTKQLTSDPWAGIASKYPVGSKHTGTVKGMTNFGVFVELEEGVDGLVHVSDLSWSKKVNHPNEFTKLGEKMEVVVLEFDGDNRKLSLGHKQIEENPWDTFETIFTLGSIHSGTVIKVQEKGAVIALPYGVEGFVPSKHMIKEDGKAIVLDETTDFKIIEFSKDQKRIVVSHSRIWEEVKEAEKSSVKDVRKKDSAATTKAIKKVKESVEKTTLGDLGVLSQLKESLESGETKKADKKGKKEKTNEETE